MNNMHNWLKEGERLDDLQRNGLHIIQHPKTFRFGMDAVLLAHFADIRLRDHVVDLGTGTGILPLLMSQKEETATFEGVEIQAMMADMATRSILMNGLEKRITIHCGDMRDTKGFLNHHKANVVVCNPPYGKNGAVLCNHLDTVTVARHETNSTLTDVIKAGARLLGYHGRFYVVFPAQRMLEVCDAMRAENIEPKRMQWVYAKASKAPYLVLVEGMKEAKASLLCMPPLIVYNEDGSETDSLRTIYHMT